MSWLAHRAVRRYSPQKGTAKLVLSYIADDVYDHKGGYALVSHRDLCGETNMNDGYLRPVIRRLIEAGELVKVARPGLENAYAIPLYPGEPGYIPPQPCEATEHVCNGNHCPVWDRLAEHDADQDARRPQKKATRPRRETKKQPAPPTAPDTLSWPAASDIDDPHPANPAGELAGPAPQPIADQAEPDTTDASAEAYRIADATCRMDALHWAERHGQRYQTRLQRQRAYAKAQGYTGWDQLLAVYVRTHGQRIEAHA